MPLDPGHRQHEDRIGIDEDINLCDVDVGNDLSPAPRSVHLQPVGAESNPTSSPKSRDEESEARQQEQFRRALPQDLELRRTLHRSEPRKSSSEEAKEDCLGDPPLSGSPQCDQNGLRAPQERTVTLTDNASPDDELHPPSRDVGASPVPPGYPGSPGERHARLPGCARDRHFRLALPQPRNRPATPA